MKVLFRLRLILVTVFVTVTASQGLAQITGDFQTKNSGNWSSFVNWNVYNGSSWIPAIVGQLPTATTSVFVQSGHVISVDDANAVCNDLNITNTAGGKLAFSAALSVLNIKGNLTIIGTANCFGTWVSGAKIIFSGAGNQTLPDNLGSFSVLDFIEVNKVAGTLSTGNSFKFNKFILTSGNFNVSGGTEARGNSAAAVINISGGTWTQISGTTRIYNSAIGNTSPIGTVTISGGSMILETSTGIGGFQFSDINVVSGGTLTLNSFAGVINIATSINVDATSTLNIALDNLALPASVTFNGVVNYNKAGAQTISSATYSHLKLSGTGTKTPGGLTTIGANGILEMASSATLNNALTVSSIGTTLIYSSSGSQAATATEWDNNFQNVTVNSGATVSMAGLTKTLNGTLTLTAGTLSIGTNGILNLNGPLVSISGYIDGSNTSDLAITGTTGGIAILPVPVLNNISLRNLSISGNRTLQMNGASSIDLSGSLTIASGATYDNGGESQIRNGGGGSISISGKFINKDADNFTGTLGAIPGITPVINAGSTIEFALNGNQIVTSRNDYFDITFSGSGIKTLSSGFNPAGTVAITGAATVDAKNYSFGSAGTNLTMTGTSRFITGGAGTKPDMQGTYNLAPGTTIEFALSSGTTIRLGSPINYANIVISGTNVSNTSKVTGLAFQSGSTFTVKAGATFKLENTNGFIGSTSTAISSSNNPTITLETGSTVEYSGTTDQTITNQLPAYTNLILSGAGNKTAPAGLLWIFGDFTKSGTSTFVHNNGTVLFDGFSSHTYTAATPVTFYNVINANTVGFLINSDMVIEKQLTLNNNSKLNLAAGNITLKSTATTTANVAQIPSSASISYGPGMFVVERFISAKRSWRFLSVPVTNSSLTFHQSWQENQSQGSSTQTNPAGYGTQITSNVTPDVTNGFDYYSANGPSVKKYNASTNTWAGIPGTGSTIETTEGLMIFVRGDRTAQGLYATPTTATLRTSGALYTGDRSFTINAGKFTSIGNPYASPVDMRTIDRTTGVDSFIYIWDPKLTGFGYGAFQTFTYIGNNYYPIPGGGSYGASDVAYNLIASGQAFFAHGTAAGAGGQLTLKETDKASNDLSLVFKPVNLPVIMLRNNLYSIDTNRNSFLVDGVLNILGNNYSNEVDGKDAIKVENFYESLSIKRDNKLLAVETKNTLSGKDTIFYNCINLKKAPYQFEVVASNFNSEVIDAYFEDTYLKTKTPLNLKGATKIDFAVTEDTLSSAPDRFHILLNEASAGTLPVTFTSVKAYQQSKNILVEWNVGNEKNIKNYVVEKSVDGQHFSIAQTINPKENNGRTNYQWLDVNTFSGKNYYRIRSVNLNEESQYSRVVNVILGARSPQILINANPIIGNAINLQFINQPKDNYILKLFNSAGQVIQTNIIAHEEGSSFETIKINQAIPSGIYLLKVLGKNYNEFSFKIFK